MDTSLMKEFLSCVLAVFLVTLLLMLVVSYPFYRLYYTDCANKTKNFYDYEYKVLGGCLIKPDETYEEFIPLMNWRDIENDK